MPVSAFVDTNVLVYLLDPADTRKQARARELLADPAYVLSVSTQVLGELFVTLTRKLTPPWPEADALEAVERVAELPVVPVDGDLVRRACRLSGSSHISFWDAQIVAAANAAGCQLLISEDLNAGQSIAGVTVINPFDVGE